MGDLVNLNKYRKTKQRREDDRQAAINREKFGRNKAETDRERQLRRQADQTLEGKKLDPDEKS